MEPDLLYISHTRSGEIVTEKHVTGAPEIVVEIGSRSTRKRDQTIKRRLYERRGYSRFAVQPDYYEDGMEAWRYERAL